jgi:hypothetical protein
MNRGPILQDLADCRDKAIAAQGCESGRADPRWLSSARWVITTEAYRHARSTVAADARSLVEEIRKSWRR